jgi:hypothetical protein
VIVFVFVVVESFFGAGSECVAARRGLEIADNIRV